MKQEPFEIVLPTWPQQSGWRYFGSDDYTNYLDDCTSAFIPLRAIREGDKWPSFNDEVRSIRNLGFFVWFDNSGTVRIDLRSNQEGRQTLREATASLKMFKRLYTKVGKRYESHGGFVRDKADIHAELLKAFQALGVKRSIQYHGIGAGETYDAMEVAVSKIASLLENRRATLKPQQAV